ncbi:hypothetical protein PCASD_19757 [Puccinia coronata f. sp. avenae]|uniref:HAT C-terminal dimerisation domain-containing protein n=1 Tax=Puccinia coronata f. sp. avenae TaxID=200324 RepID=A0A2N5TUB5_9BASI|nr:hypothetical protein PCASD_19757 [Puccinia coronata f. sp. avenae]
MQDANYVFEPTEKEWAQLETICKFLSMFHTATLELGGTKYPTATLVFKHFKQIQQGIAEGKNSEHMEIVELVEPMEAKFDKYWDSMKQFALITQIFDPRYKTELMEFLLTDELGKNAVAQEIASTKKTLYSWFTSYSKSKKKKDVSTAHSAEGTEIECLSKDTNDYCFKRYLAGKKSNQVVSATSEIDLYLQEPTVEIEANGAPKLDLLGWWKINQLQFPTLAQLAKTILTAPMTSIAYESAFSSGGRILSDFRSKLDPTTVEALVCGQDWIKNGSKEENEDDS